MKRFLQVLFFITIISAVFASVAPSDGCNEGRVWSTKGSTGCMRCECHNNVEGCVRVPLPCENEGSWLEFKHFADSVEPPTVPNLYRRYTEVPSEGIKGPEPEANFRALEVPMPYNRNEHKSKGSAVTSPYE